MCNSHFGAVPATKPCVEDEFLRLRLKYENRGLFVVVGGSCDVVTIQLRRPKRGSGSRPRRYFRDGIVMIPVFLLVGENVPHVIVAASGNVGSFVRSIKIYAIHSVNLGENRNFLTGSRIHSYHLRRSSCSHNQPVRLFVKGSVTVALTADGPRGYNFALFCVHNLNFTRGHGHKQRLPGLIEQQFRRMRFNSDVANMLVCLGINDRDFAIILTGILAAISYVQNFSSGIVGDSVGTGSSLIASSSSSVSPRNTRSIPSSPLATNTLLSDET